MITQDMICSELVRSDLQGMIMAEMWMDQVARTVGRPVEAVRELNMYKEGDFSPYGQIISSSQVSLCVCMHLLTQQPKSCGIWRHDGQPYTACSS